MKRTSVTYSVKLDEVLKRKLLHWAGQFHEVAWLDSNEYAQDHSSYHAILAVDALTSLQTDYENAFQDLDEYQGSINDWLFGYLTYDLKNDVEELSSGNHDGLGFPDLVFFQPKRLFLFSESTVEIRYLNMISEELERDWEEILNFNVPASEVPQQQLVKIRLRTSKDSYFENVNSMNI